MIPKPPSDQPKLQITPEMMRAFKTLTCDCGGQLFEHGIVIKKISSIISPSGREEAYPLEVIVCKNCKKVPNELNVSNMLPEQVLATPAPAYETSNVTSKDKKGPNNLTIVQ